MRRLLRLPAGFLVGILLTARADAQEIPPSGRNAPPPPGRNAPPPPSRNATPPAASDKAPAPYTPMIFPLCGSPRFQKELIDSFGDPRGGGTRRHEGQDMMAPQMTPLLAVFNGVVLFQRTDEPNAHNKLRLIGDNGWIAVYLHINNDSPQTNDGSGSREYAFAPNLRPGQRVIAGQFLGYVGNSGNAETIGHHLHFELQDASGPVNAYVSLKRAQILTAPRWNPPRPELRPESKEIRLDATIRETDAAQNRLRVFCVAWQRAGKTTIETSPVVKWIRVNDQTLLTRQDDDSPLPFARLRPGDNLIVLAPATEDANGLSARRILVHPISAPVTEEKSPPR